MFIFLFLAIPLALIFFLASEQSKGSFWAAMALSFFTAIIFCFVDEFFIFATHHFTQNIAANFFYIYLKDNLLPSLLLSTSYLLLSRKEWSRRLLSLFPLLAAYYMVYIPYSVITGNERFSFFLCFIKPLLAISYTGFAALSASTAYCLLQNRDGVPADRSAKKQRAAYGLIAAAFVQGAVFSLTETLWYMNFTPLLWIGLSILQAVLLAALYLFASKKAVSD